jgi:hypothetical protein
MAKRMKSCRQKVAKALVENGPVKPESEKHTDDLKIWLELSPEIDSTTLTVIPGGGDVVENVPGTESCCWRSELQAEDCYDEETKTGEVGGNLYVFRKVESHANFQPTKSPSK